MWHLERNDECFVLVDIKPTNMNELNEVLTSVEFHPKECNTFTFSSSKGMIYFADMRTKALCDKNWKVICEKEKSKSFFSEVTSSISDLCFSKDGRYLLSRDYLQLKLWDPRVETQPVVSFNVHDHLRSRLYELYEHDNIFDKFECCFGTNDLHLLTGSYSNNFSIFDIATQQAKYFQAVNPRDRRKKKQTTLPTTEDINFDEKVTHVAWHPINDLIAVAAGNYIYLYHLANP
jgi:serine/threonine-protein phosphatase 2A regulatory subunit B